MRVNIVVGGADAGWIWGRLATELVDRLPAYGVDAVLNQSTRADLNYELVYGAPSVRPAVGFFTHGDFRPKNYAREYDGHVCLNEAMAQYLRVAGVDPFVVQMPVGDVFRPQKPLVFGVAGRTYSDGRKGEALVKHMVDGGYTVRAWGSGWPCQIVSSSLTDLVPFYRGLDYYVDTSTDEGGCVPALECMALGVPVISHTVGVDRPVLSYERGSWESLSKVLHQLTRPRTYDEWARDHAAVFQTVFSRIREEAFR